MLSWMRIPMFTFSLFLVFAGLAGLAPRGAAAADTAIEVSGTVEGGEFVGVVSDLFVSVDADGALVVNGQLDGTVILEEDEIAVSQDFVATLQVLDGTNCRLLQLAIGPIFVEALGAELHLSEITLETHSGGLLGGLLRDLTCTVTDLLEEPDVDNERLAKVLNRIVDRLLD